MLFVLFLSLAFGQDTDPLGGAQFEDYGPFLEDFEEDTEAEVEVEVEFVVVDQALHAVGCQGKHDHHSDVEHRIDDLQVQTRQTLDLLKALKAQVEAEEAEMQMEAAAEEEAPEPEAAAAEDFSGVN